MEDKASVKAAMVSRLPKFGGRSSGGGTVTTSSNGCGPPTAPGPDGRGGPAGAPPNGLICAAPFSPKWKRDEGPGRGAPSIPAGDGCEDKPLRLPPAQEARNGLPGTPRARRSGALALAVSSPRAVPKQPLKTSPRGGSVPGHSLLGGGLKVAHSLESRLARPKPSSQDGLSEAGADHMVRSNSFTHFRQIPSPSSQPMTRSFSFTRAVELAQPLASTQLRPPRSASLRPPQLSNGRVGPGLGPLSPGGGLPCSKPQKDVSSVPSVPGTPGTPGTPGALKKPLLPSCVLTKSLCSSGGSLAQRLSSSSPPSSSSSSSSSSPSTGQLKQLKSLFPGGTREVSGSEAAPEAPGLLGVPRDHRADQSGSPSESQGSSADGGAGREAAGLVWTQGRGPAPGEASEDTSLSSASSLDRVEFSEGFLDDCSVGNDPGDGSSNREQSLQSSLNDTLDWDNMDLEGPKEGSPMEDSQGPLLLSSEQSDVLQASSVELSPSNSSGGTYMWDEDGLEAFVGAGMQPCDNDDSELNSTDILNNLEAPGNGELDDEDLVLDAHLPEDTFRDADRMSHLERLERGSRQGQRRKHQRWGSQDRFHYDNRSHNALQHYDGLKAQRLSTRLAPSEGGRSGYLEMLDELTLQHMTQDCSLLKNQLLRLKTLLQLEDTDLSADVPAETEDNSAASQLEELMKEVRVLKAELRTRDKTITQLTFQIQQHEQAGQQTRCHCHHQRAPSSLQRDRREQQHHHYDKATQTHWKLPAPGHAPQILQPSSRCLSELLPRGRPVRPPPTEGRSDHAHHWGQQEDDAHQALLSADPPPPASSASRPRALRPLALRQRASLLAPPPAGGPAGPGPPTEHARQLPPPSRGLPSFSLTRTSLLQPQRTSRSSRGAPEPVQGGPPGEPGCSKVPPTPGRSCLPKPKTP